MTRLAFFIMFVLIGMAGCGGKSDQALAQGTAPAPQPTSDTSAPAASTTAPAPSVRPLALPTLDRSTDLRGPDANSNEVRDDIEAWINSQPYTQEQRRAAMQAARAMQRTLLVDLNDAAALQRVADGISAAIVCAATDPVTTGLTARMEAITANTRERAKRYLQFNRALSGGVYRLPEPPACE